MVPCRITSEKKGRETAMQGSLTWIATAALFASLLSGCVAQAEVSGRTVLHGMSSPAGKEAAVESSPIDRSSHRRLETILHAPTAFDCRGQGANDDVFEEQCESNTRSGD
jgi:hypothetical protein